MTPDEQDISYPLSRCISCCCCMEACPQFNEKTGFVGAAKARALARALACRQAASSREGERSV